MHLETLPANSNAIGFIPTYKRHTGMAMRTGTGSMVATAPLQLVHKYVHTHTHTHTYIYRHGYAHWHWLDGSYRPAPAGSHKYRRNEGSGQ
jgi:hypothetical protein